MSHTLKMNENDIYADYEIQILSLEKSLRAERGLRVMYMKRLLAAGSLVTACLVLATAVLCAALLG